PSADYAFLFASDTQRILFPRPKVEDAAATVTSVVAPRLADPYALLKAGGLFPRPADAIGIVTPWALTAASRLLRPPPPKAGFNAPSLSRQLVDTAAWGARVAYDAASTAFAIDSAKNWAVGVKRISQVLSFNGLGEIMRVVHDIHSPTDAPANFPKPG